MKLLRTMCLLAGMALSAEEPAVPFPTGFRAWQHVKSGLIGPASPAFREYGGLHHIYANPTAAAGLATGKFADGAVLVFDLLDVAETGGNTVEGARKKIEVMVKDAGRYPSTGGWGFERFSGDGHDAVLPAGGREKCFACHKAKAAHGFVFSELRN